MPDGETVWIVGKYIGKFATYDNSAVFTSWELQGIMPSREMAVAACCDINWFIARLRVGLLVPESVKILPGLCWPVQDRIRAAAKQQG